MSVPVRLYVHFFFIDMAIGVVLSVLGFFAPDRYVGLTLSPLSAAESYAFLLATPVFAVYVWITKADRRLFAFPGFVVAGQIWMTTAFYFSFSAMGTSRISLEAAQLEALQTPLYLSASLLCSLGGIALWICAGSLGPSDTTDAPERLRNLREKRRLAAESRR